MEDQLVRPRHKRKLGGSDGVSSSAPRPKRVSYGKTTLEDNNAAPEEEDTAPVKENTAPTEENTSSAEGKAAPVEKTAPVEEKTPKMRIEKRIMGGQLMAIVHDGTEELPSLPADASAELEAAANDTPEEDDMTKRVKEEAHDADGNTWICVCRSKADMRREHPEVGDKTEYHPWCWSNCVCSRFANRNREHKWIFTKKGMNVCRDGLDQAKSRDQEIMGVFVFDRWNSYAVCEVVENMLAAFNKAVKSPDDWFTVLAHTEGLGRFLQFLESDFAYYYDNDREGNAKRLMLIGTALLSAIDVLKSHSLFNAIYNTEIRNIGLVLCHYLQFAYDQRETPRLNEAGWTRLVIRRAEEHGIRIEDFYGIEKVISALKRPNAGNGGNASDVGRLPPGGITNMVYAYQSAPPLEGILTVERVKAHEKGGTRRDWGRYDLKKETAAYRRHQMVKVGANGPEDYRGTKIGGMFYDLTGSFGTMLMREQMIEAREKEREAERIEKEKRRVEREAMWAAKRR
ncbi:MAG: hypothetical protein Q9208_001648 [Pyrenodesmia sp. 3 TL-2023]